MPAIVLFGIQFTLALAAYALIAWWYVAPRLSGLPREVALRRRAIKRHFARQAHRVCPDIRTGALQRPRRMMDLTADQATSTVDVQAITLGKELLERSFVRELDRRNRLVARAELRRRCRRLRAARAVCNLAPALDNVHLGLEVGQVEPESSRAHCCPARGVEAEKPHAALLAATNVSPYVELGECGQPWQGRHSMQAHATHTERDHAQPGLPIEQVELEARRKAPPQILCRHRPVRKQEIVPALVHRPPVPRKRA